MYSSVPGKCSWALNIPRDFWPAWALTWDQNSIRLYTSCYSGPLKCGTWALTREWALAQDTTITVIFSIIIIIMEIATKGEDNLYYLHRSSQQLPVSRSSRHVEGSRIAKQLAPYMGYTCTYMIWYMYSKHDDDN